MTATATLIPTATASSTATPPGCLVTDLGAAPAPPGVVMTPGALTDADCTGSFGAPASVRIADSYTIAGTPGTAIKIEVVANGFSPWVKVIDSASWFGTAEAAPPLEFYLSSSRSYEILITSNPGAPAALGTYTLKLTPRSCPVTALSGNLNLIGQTLSASDCPDPSDPFGRAKAYSFTVNGGDHPGMTMHATSGSLDPFLELIGPSGRLVAADDNGENPTSFTATGSTIAFLGIQAGTYKLFAGGGALHGLGNYNLFFSNLTPCTVRAVTATASVTSVSASLTASDCNTPLLSPDPLFSLPELNTNADLYSVNLNAGDVFTATVVPDDNANLDPHVWFLAPDKKLLQDRDISELGDAEAQIGYTVGTTGTYTLVVGANNLDATVNLSGDPAFQVPNYSVLVQRCPATSAVVGTPIAATLLDADCEAFGGIKTRSYKFTTNTPRFLTLTANADLFLPRLTLIGNDDQRAESTVDPFGIDASRVSRVLPAGTHYFEISGIDIEGPLPPPLDVDLSLQSCPAQELAEGVTSGEFTDGDCKLTDGTPLDAYTISGALNNAASLLLPASGCSYVALPDGVSIPRDGCLSEHLPVPIAKSGTAAVLVAASSAAQRGPYQLTYRKCPLVTVGELGTTGQITAVDCLDAENSLSDFYLFRAATDRVVANTEVTGTLTANFNTELITSDGGGAASAAGPIASFDQFAPDALSYAAIPPCQSGNGGSPCLGFLLQVRSSGDTGTYQLLFDPLP